MPATFEFAKIYTALTGNAPFPWQAALYQRFIAGTPPAVADIPTGLGKTSIVAIWLIALSHHPDCIPRRLVYVVNRRTVVDQTTAEVERLRTALGKPELAETRRLLASLCALPLPTPDAQPLAISTLRGQFADNSEWCADPTRPAVIVGTVDMIGSGLLFNRYTRGFKTRPLHAGFLGQDVLLVHDEAHLEPAFQTLLNAIVATQRHSGDQRKLHVIELTATSRATSTNGTEKPFGLDENLNDKDTDNDTVKRRIGAAKRLSLVPVTRIAADGKDKANGVTVRDRIIDSALAKKDSGRAIAIFVCSVDAAINIQGALEKMKKGSVATLTGTMRGKERDELVSKNPVFQRFVPERDRAHGVSPAACTVYLVATSAGEVGINISADDLICDLNTFDSMAQRFGRVNRFGDSDDSEIVVVYRENLQAFYTEGLAKAKSAPKDADKKVASYENRNQRDLRRIKTLALLKRLEGSASPFALNRLDACERVAAFSPEPKQRFASDVQFDAWTLTSIRCPIAARPSVAPYLHGEAEWQPPETQVAWRQELDVLDTAELRTAYPPAEVLDDFPLKPHELLRDTSERIVDHLMGVVSRLKCNASIPDAWLVREDGEVEVFPLSRLLSDQVGEDDSAGDEDEEEEPANASDAKRTEKMRKKRLASHLADATLILPASLGGIDGNGVLTPDVGADPGANADVADVIDDGASDKRQRVWSNSLEVPTGFRVIRIIDRLLVKEGTDETADRSATNRYWLWLEAKNANTTEPRSIANTQRESLAAHSAAVAANATAIAEKLLPPDLGRLLVCAARVHDLGKDRRQWQRNLGNVDYDPAQPETILAKSEPGMRSRSVAEHYRHEFGSLNDAGAIAEFAAFDDAERDVVLHLVAAHHGRARPHFPVDEVGDDTATPATNTALAIETPRRFARLQRRFGRWGLAWLESLLRAADYAASAGVVAKENFHSGGATHGYGKTTGPTLQPTAMHVVPTARLAVNPINPGHFFACCGIFELASRLAPDALAWFEQDHATHQWHFKLANTLGLGDLLRISSSAEIVALSADDRAKSIIEIRLQGAKRNVMLDWWRQEGRDIGKLKPWAGNTSVRDIADDMRRGLNVEITAATGGRFDEILFTRSIANKGEPFYFDANRAVNARAQDVGFSSDKLRKGGIRISTETAPAVELFTLIGLQRGRPLLAVNRPGAEREYDYFIWTQPLRIALLAAAASGFLPDCSEGFRFANAPRAKDYRAFGPAKHIRTCP